MIIAMGKIFARISFSVIVFEIMNLAGILTRKIQIKVREIAEKKTNTDSLRFSHFNQSIFRQTDRKAELTRMPPTGSPRALKASIHAGNPPEYT